MIWFDWQMVFWPALQAWLSGQDPYLTANFMSPPWLLPLIAPFGLVPIRWGAFGMNIVAVTGLVALSIRLRKPGVTLLVGGSFVFMAVILDANVEGYVLWGLALGGPVGLLLLSVKPQVAILVGVVWMIRAWNQARWWGILRLGLPALVVALVFTAIYPQWIGAALRARALPTATNVNLWPWLLPVAAGAMLWSVVKLRQAGAAVATALVSPYFLVHSYLAAMALVAAESPWLGAIAVAASWVYFFVAYAGI